MQAYRNMMKSLLTFQGVNGMWRQLIDYPEAWADTSSTAMFAFALISGVKNEWLEERTYAPAARKGWLGPVSYISADGDFSDACDGTNKKNDLQYYLNRARKTGDLHGKAAILWAPTP
jgi:rhamnogalacturonyl hydrolase YesR